MPENNFKFLVVGAGRGGTSLIAGLLDAHRSLEVGLELFSVSCLMGKDENLHGSNLFDERVTAFISACRLEAERYPGLAWGNKITTEQIFGLEDHNASNPAASIDVLDAFFNEYLKGIKIVFILRDGRTCANSKVQRTGQSFETACERWKYSVEIYKFLNTRHSNNLCIRFEDLLHTPQSTLGKVCDFLDIPYQETMLQGTSNTKMLPEYQQKTIDPSKTASVVIPEACLQSMSEDLKFCGYL